MTMTSAPYYRIRGRILDREHYLEWKRQGSRRYYDCEQIEEGLRKRRPRTGTLLDYMEGV